MPTFSNAPGSSTADLIELTITMARHQVGAKGEWQMGAKQFQYARHKCMHTQSHVMQGNQLVVYLNYFEPQPFTCLSLFGMLAHATIAFQG